MTPTPDADSWVIEPFQSLYGPMKSATQQRALSLKSSLETAIVVVDVISLSSHVVPEVLGIERSLEQRASEL